ncbi:MAG: NAD(P)/FAD-dependent oxidoreductase [Nitrososphaerales archaeon]
MNRYDIVIIGAGILGASSAYYLKKNNPPKDILLLDRYSGVGQGNTARSNAMFRNTFTSKENRVLADTAINFYFDVQNKGDDLGLKKCGYLWLLSEEQLKENQPHIDDMMNSGIELKLYDTTLLKKDLPCLRTEFQNDDEASLIGLNDVSCGIFGIKCGRLDPSKLAKYYEKRFVELGGKVRFNANVTSLLVKPDKPLGIEGEPFVFQESSVQGVRAEGLGEIEAGTIVLAAGAWNNELLEPIGMDGHVKAKKRQLYTIPAKGSLSKLLETKNFNGSFPFTILPKSGCFVKGVEENNEFWVGCEDDIGREFLNIPGSLEDCVAERDYYEKSIYPILKGYLPDFENTSPRTMWAGYYGYNTLDSTPYVFSQNGLVVVGGDSGSGIMKGDALGRIVDAVYREQGEANLFGDVSFDTEKLGFTRRNVEMEHWVI